MTHVLTRLRKLWELTGGEFQGPVLDNPAPPEPFLQFPCADCGLSITLDNPVQPGDAVVINCPSCNASMTVYCPSLLIRKTKDLPEGIGKKIWTELSG